MSIHSLRSFSYRKADLFVKKKLSIKGQNPLSYCFYILRRLTRKSNRIAVVAQIKIGTKVSVLLLLLFLLFYYYYYYYEKIRHGLFYFHASDRSISNIRGVWLAFINAMFYRNSCIKCKQGRPRSDAALWDITCRHKCVFISLLLVLVLVLFRRVTTFPASLHVITCTKTRLFKYTENFTTKKW